MTKRKTPVYKTPQEQLFDGCMKAARANHYLVRVVTDHPFAYEDVVRVAQKISDRHNCGRISYAMENRALMLLSEATGYSLSDLGA